MRILLFAAVFLTAAVLPAAEKFSFVRPLEAGSCFRCFVQTRQSARYKFSLPGRDDPKVKLDTVQAEFAGWLQIRQVNAAGNPSSIRIRIERLTGSLNGKTIQNQFPFGTRLDAELSPERSKFTVEGKPVPPEIQVLLQTLFPPAENSLRKLTGAGRILPKPGQGWQPDLTSFLKQLDRRRIQLPASAFRSGITYFGPERVGRFPCRKFGLLIETAKPSDFDCRIKMTFWLAPSGPPVRMTREAREVIRQVMRGDQPFAYGTVVDLHCEDHTEQTLFPVDRIPDPVPQGKKSGAWDSLIR